MWWGGWKGASASSFRLPARGGEACEVARFTAACAEESVERRGLPAALGGGGSGIGIGVGPRYEPLEIWRIMS